MSFTPSLQEVSQFHNFPLPFGFLRQNTNYALLLATDVGRFAVGKGAVVSLKDREIQVAPAQP